MQDYRNYSMVIVKNVKFIQNDARISGKAADIDDDGTYRRYTRKARTA